MNGADVPRRVGLDNRTQNADAIVPEHKMAEGSVKDLVKNPEGVKSEIVKVSKLIKKIQLGNVTVGKNYRTLFKSHCE